MAVSVGIATPNDLVELHILLERFYEESKFNEIIGSDWDDETMFRWLAFVVQAPQFLCVLAREDDKLVGCMIAEINHWHTNFNDPVVFEEVWYVMPEFRGNGHARALIEKLEEWAKLHKAKAIELGTASTMQEKKTGRFMSQLGYKKTRTIHTKKLEDE